MSKQRTINIGQSLEPGATAGGGRGLLVVVSATVAMAVGFGGLGLASVFMRPMEADLGWSRSDTSLGYALSTAGMAFGGLIWGRLSDRTDVRLLLAFGAAGMVTSLLAMSTLHSLTLFYLASLIYGGFGFSALYSPLLSTSGEWFPEQRGLVMGVVTAGGAAGQGLLPYFAAFLINASGWRWAFFGVSCVVLACLALSLPVLRWPHGTRARAADRLDADAPPRTETAMIALLAAAAFLCCTCMGVPVVHLASFRGYDLRFTTSWRHQPGRCDDCRCRRPGLLWRHRRPHRPAAGLCGRLCDPDGLRRGLPGGRTTDTPLLMLSAVFGFAGNMTCLSLCVREAVPAARFGGAIGTVMMVAWFGMATGGYMGGVLFDLSRSYMLPFMLASLSGGLNLLVLGSIALAKARLKLSFATGGS